MHNENLMLFVLEIYKHNTVMFLTKTYNILHVSKWKKLAKKATKTALAGHMFDANNNT